MEYVRLLDERLECDELSACSAVPQGSSPTNDSSINAIDLFTSRVLKHHKDLEDSEAQLKEILQIQNECISGLAEENSRYRKMFNSFNFTTMFTQISFYTKKLNLIRNEMSNIQDRVTRLKQRAFAVKETQERKVNEIRDAKALQEERERLLIARPVWEVDQLQVREKS